MGSVVLDVGPTHEPITVADAKLHLNIETTDDDIYITSLITAARQYVENFLQRTIITQTWSYYLDAFLREMVLPQPKLISVSAITYVDTGGTTQTLSSSIYQVDNFKEPARVVLAYGQSWPTTRSQINAVRIQYVAGYGADTQVPETIKQAIKIMIGHWFENREPVIVGTSVMPMPMSAESLLLPYLAHRF